MGHTSTYRADIDGLRALAVLGVIVFHYGASWLPGGFIGVDIFFVISGHLITTTVMGEIGEDRFSLIGFYGRRVRRIFPALIVVTLSSLVVGWFILTPGDYAALGESSAYSAFGLGNLYFYWNTEYFDQYAHLQPLLHTWSLGVEEQFYVVWPLFLILATTFLPRRVVVFALAVLVVMGFSLSIFELARNAKAAFYMPYARAWELALGGLTAIAPTIRGRALSTLASAVGLLVIGWSFVTVEASSFPGVQAILPCVGAALLVWSKETGALDKGLTRLKAVGLISYSLYLWHWPVLVFFRHYAGAEPTALQLVAIAAATTLLSVLSWRFVEQPFRRSGAKVSAVWMAVPGTALVVTFGLGLAHTQGIVERAPPPARAMISLETMWDWPCAQSVSIEGVSYCGFGANWDTADVRVMLWGDSHAQHLAPVLEATYKSAAFVLAGPCLPFAGGGIDVDLGDASYVETCRQWHEWNLQALEIADVDAVVLSASWAGRVHQLVSERVSGTPQDLFAHGLTSLLDNPRMAGRGIVLVSDSPWINAGAIPSCLAAREYLWRAPCAELGLSRDMFREVSDFATETIRDAATSRGLQFVDPALRLCDRETCRTDLGGLPFYRDSDHFRRNLEEDELLKLAGLLSLDKLSFSISR